ncbi:MAG TPA: malectin domain-containing carbohydrate-binding protein, partial [Kribbellaceae bacterium]
MSAVPGSNTPDVNNGAVYAITQVGNRIILGGTFTSASPRGSTTAVTRNHILAFDATTGAIDPGFAPNLDGEVDDLTPGPSPNTVYAAGFFNNVNGARSKGVALLNTTNGQMVTGFRAAPMNGGVYGVRLAGDRLIIGGIFTTVGDVQHQGIATLNPATGALDPFMNVQFTEHHNYDGTGASAAVGPRKLDISPDGHTLVAIGNFKRANGLLRDQVVRIKLDGSAPAVDSGWATAAYSAACYRDRFDTYMRDVSFSPDGKYFVIVTTGGAGKNTDGTNSSCDAAARWDMAATGGNVRPAWLNYTGKDTLTAVAITGTAVYVGGHQRWLNNTFGSDSAGPGAVPRPGIAALDPVNGLPFSWNPGRHPRGIGAFALFANAQGLYVGSDTEYIGDHQYQRKRVAFFPLAGGKVVPPTTTATLPSNVYLAGLPNSSVTGVLYRVNAGGPALAATDGGPGWLADQAATSPYRNSGSSVSNYSAVPSVDGTVPSSTPRAIFDNERWDIGAKGDGQEMRWSFPVAAGTPVEVRLYFANRWSGSSQVGQRVFDLTVNGTLVADNFDIVAAAGHNVGTTRKFETTSTGTVTIDFGHEVQNPLVDGIEIVK